MSHVYLRLRVLKQLRRVAANVPRSTGQETGGGGSPVFIAMAAGDSILPVRGINRKSGSVVWKVGRLTSHQLAIWALPRLSRERTALS